MILMKYICPLFSTLFLSCSFVFFTSCGDDEIDENSAILYDDLPSSALVTYTGKLVFFNDTGENLTNLSGTATIISNGNSTYAINFSDNVPSIEGLLFIEDKEDGGYFSQSIENSSQGIVIEGTELIVGLTMSAGNWQFAGER